MGLFGSGHHYEKKEQADWEQAECAEHSIHGKRGFVMISDYEQTMVPKAPWIQYKDEAGAEAVSEWYMLYYNNAWGEVIGHTEYAKALNELEPFVLDSNSTYLLIRKLSEDELYRLVETAPEREDYFSYVGELPEDVRAEIEMSFQKGVQVFGISAPEDGAKMAEQIMNIVDEILETGELPEAYEDITDVAVALGVMFGQALCCGHGWKWKVFGDSPEQASFGVVSPEDNFCNTPMPYLLRILTGQNINSYGENDNTVLLLYNMLENIDKRPKKERYYPLA